MDIMMKSLLHSSWIIGCHRVDVTGFATTNKVVKTVVQQRRCRYRGIHYLNAVRRKIVERDDSSIWCNCQKRKWNDQE